MYSFLGLHYTRWAWFLKPLSFFIRIRIYPESVTQSTFKETLEGKTIIYVLPRMSIMDTIVLNKALTKLGLEKAQVEAKPKRFQHAAIMALKPRSLIFSSLQKDKFIKEFLLLMRQDPRYKQNKLVFIPVSIFWSRAPEKDEQGFLFRSLFPDDGTGNGLQKLFMLLLHRGEVNVAFGKAFDALHLETSEEKIKSDESQNSIQESTETNEILRIEHENARRMRRLFNIEFAKERTVAFGPPLYDNEKICQWILNSEETKKFITASDNPLKIEKQIVRYIHEIGANYNYVTIRALEKVFDFVWTRIFDGVRVRNFDLIERCVKDGQIIWMPNHRSHFDYMLLSYVLFKKGFVIPHIAAGINLNFWPISSILRGGGAFFIRRSFAGNRVYAHTFAEYVNYLMQNSFPIQFFQEGGRSRIGKLLTPKTGLLSIAIQSVLERKAENTYIIPICFGYDKVMEDDNYAKELRGAKKQKENALQFLKGIFKFFSKYGSVDVSFGSPIRIGDMWEEYVEKLKRETLIQELDNILPKNIMELPTHIEARDPKIQGFVKFLAKRVNQRVNLSATASNTALLATALLSRSQNALSYYNLQNRIILIHYLINSFSEAVGWKLATINNISSSLDFLLNKNNMLNQNSEESTDTVPTYMEIGNISDQIFTMGEKWNFITRVGSDKSDSKFFINPNKAFNLWWYRGTIFHILAPFGIIATYLLNSKEEDRTVQKVEAKLSAVRRIWQDELYWDNQTSSHSILEACLNILSKLTFISLDAGLIKCSEDPEKLQSLKFLSGIIRPEIELFGLQLLSATKILKVKNSFTNDELLQKSFMNHTEAYDNSLVSLEPIFSKVFAQRIFDSFYKIGAFKPVEGQKLTLNILALAGVSDFLDLKF